jgi:hypothetical protein
MKIRIISPMSLTTILSEKDALWNTGKIGNPVGVVYPKIKSPRQATLSPALGFNRERRCRSR